MRLSCRRLLICKICRWSEGQGGTFFSSARDYPSMPAFMQSSMTKYSFCRYGCRLAVPSSREGLFYLMNFHVWNIQEGEINLDRAGRLFEKIFTEHNISSLWYLMRSLRWWHVRLFIELLPIKAWMWFFPWVPYKVKLLIRSRERGAATMSLWRFLGSPES